MLQDQSEKTRRRSPKVQTGDKQLVERSIYISGPGGIGLALRNSDWKLILTEQKGGQPKGELFNLANDPNETTNLAEANLEVVTRLKLKLEAVRRRDVPFRN